LERSEEWANIATAYLRVRAESSSELPAEAGDLELEAVLAGLGAVPEENIGQSSARQILISSIRPQIVCDDLAISIGLTQGGRAEPFHYPNIGQQSTESSMSKQQLLVLN
jgi:hypothetical protein